MTDKNFTRQYQNIESITVLLKDQAFSTIIKNDFFQNSLPYPSQDDYKVNKVCEHCGSKYKDEDSKTKLHEARNKYRQENNRLYGLFKESLFVVFNLEHNEKTEKAFSIAWEQGHSRGFYEVYQCFEELAPLLED
jgi:hypothetical protein